MPDDVLRDDLYDRTPARHWARGPIVLAGDAAHPMRAHLGQGGCQGLEDAAILAAFVDRAPDLPTVFERFAAFRRPRVTSLVRESAWLGKARHMATIAARSAFVLPADTIPQYPGNV